MSKQASTHLHVDYIYSASSCFAANSTDKAFSQHS